MLYKGQRSGHQASFRFIHSFLHSQRKSDFRVWSPCDVTIGIGGSEIKERSCRTSISALLVLVPNMSSVVRCGFKERQGRLWVLKSIESGRKSNRRRLLVMVEYAFECKGSSSSCQFIRSRHRSHTPHLLVQTPLPIRPMNKLSLLVPTRHPRDSVIQLEEPRPGGLGALAPHHQLPATAGFELRGEEVAVQGAAVAHFFFAEGGVLGDSS
jgi:hypothetical protein